MTDGRIEVDPALAAPAGGRRSFRTGRRCRSSSGRARRLGQPHLPPRRRHEAPLPERRPLRGAGRQGARAGCRLSPRGCRCRSRRRWRRARPGYGYPWPWSVQRLARRRARRRSPASPTAPASPSSVAGFLAGAAGDPGASGGPPAGAHSFHRGGALATYDAETRALPRAPSPARSTPPAPAPTWEAGARRRPGAAGRSGSTATSPPATCSSRDGRLAAVIDFGSSARRRSRLRPGHRLDLPRRRQPRRVPRRGRRRPRHLGPRPRLGALEGAARRSPAAPRSTWSARSPAGSSPR